MVFNFAIIHVVDDYDSKSKADTEEYYNLPNHTIYPNLLTTDYSTALAVFTGYRFCPIELRLKPDCMSDSLVPAPVPVN
jgi:hypothetical protein